MVKFKAGERVRRTVKAHEMFGGSEEFVIDRAYDSQVTEKKGGESFWHSVDSLELADGPIRTVTVTCREIVPGDFGRLKTITVGSLGVSGASIPVSVENRFYTASDLREAAKLFNELADVLEENAG